MSIKKVFITGASRGIGKAIAERYHDEGYELITPSRSELDLSSINSITKFLSRFPMQVDVLVNNAGQNIIKNISDITLDNWQTTLSVNLTAPFLFFQQACQFMIKNNWGRVVNISSIYSLISREGRAAYSASKAGLNGYTRTAALEYAKHGILVNSVCPGFVDTDLTRQNNSPEQIQELVSQVPLKKLGSPEDIAGFVYFLGSEQNNFITGQIIPIDGGFTSS